MSETLEQQTGQFGGEAGRWRVFQTIALDVADPCFGGVGKHKADIGIARQRQILVKLMINIDFAVDGTNDARITHRFALLVQAADDGGVQAILRAERRRKIGVNRANDHDTGVQIGMFI